MNTNGLAINDVVKVDWQRDVDGSRYKDGVNNWPAKKVVGFRQGFGNAVYAMLEGCPLCPVRVERCDKIL